jgi:hypothetical protein
MRCTPCSPGSALLRGLWRARTWPPALREGFVYGARYSVPAPTSWAPGGRPDGDRFVGFLQNHDQVGNRARGERLSQLVSPGAPMIGAALVLTSPFVPMLFHGESGAPAHRFSTSPTTRTRRSGAPSATDGAASSPPSARRSRTCRTRRLPRPSTGPSWTGGSLGANARRRPDWYRRLIRLAA